jgi:DNA-directed RNA polymerase specialized sigma24 family protein
MIHLRCTRGHETARPDRRHLLDDPHCHMMTPAGFCAAALWQDPATTRKGDVVATVDDRRIIRCILTAWTGDPDQQATLIDEFGMTRRLLLDSWFTPGQPYPPTGEPLFTVDDAESIRPHLEQIARDARADARVRRPVDDDVRTPGHGGREVYDIPLKLYDHRMDAGLSSGLSVRLEEYPQFAAAMAWMEKRYPQYYRMLTLNIHEGRRPADMRTLLSISESNARVRLHRARQKLRAAMASLPVTGAAGEHTVESPGAGAV